jgi:helix-turn-helix protein
MILDGWKIRYYHYCDMQRKSKSIHSQVVAEKLVKARKARFPDLPAAHVATEYLGISRQRLFFYESGLVTPPLDMLIKLLSVYEMQPHELMKGLV